MKLGLVDELFLRNLIIINIHVLSETMIIENFES